MPSFLEVTGRATLIETASAYHAELEFTPLDRSCDLEAVADKFSSLMRSAGVETERAGNPLSDAWQARRPELQAALQGYRLSVQSRDPDLLEAALTSLEPYIETSSYRIEVILRAPRFSASPEALVEARRRAIDDARSHAQLIARETDLRLGGVCEVEELQPSGAQLGSEPPDIRTPGSVSEGAAREREIAYRIRFLTAAD